MTDEQQPTKEPYQQVLDGTLNVAGETASGMARGALIFVGGLVLVIVVLVAVIVGLAT